MNQADFWWKGEYLGTADRDLPGYLLRQCGTTDRGQFEAALRNHQRHTDPIGTDAEHREWPWDWASSHRTGRAYWHNGRALYEYQQGRWYRLHYTETSRLSYTAASPGLFSFPLWDGQKWVKAPKSAPQPQAQPAIALLAAPPEPPPTPPAPPIPAKELVPRFASAIKTEGWWLVQQSYRPMWWVTNGTTSYTLKQGEAGWGLWNADAPIRASHSLAIALDLAIEFLASQSLRNAA